MSENPVLEILPAEAGDALELTRIAQAAKGHWGYPPEWMQLWKDELTLRPDYIRENPICKALQEGRIVGFYGLSHLSSQPELEHLWVDPAFLGQGIGSRLLRHAQQTAHQLGIRRLRIESDPNAEGFYRSKGAIPCGQVETNIPGRKLPLLVLDCSEQISRKDAKPQRAEKNQARLFLS